MHEPHELPPGLRPLSLEKCLRKLGAPRLCRLVGESRLDAIHDVLEGGINEARLTQILQSRYGSQILRQDELRKAVVETLSNEALSFLATGDTGAVQEDKARPALYKHVWRRDDDITARYLQLFGLDDSYLPPVRDVRPSTITLAPEISLFPHQLRLKDEFVRFLLEDNRRVLLHMPTGAGKTRSCVEGLSDLWRCRLDRNGCIIWLAHSEELCEQAVQTFRAIWKHRGDFEVTLRRLWGQHELVAEDVESSFIVASLQKLHSLKKSSNDKAFETAMALKRHCEVVVIDEAHKAIAETYQATIDLVSGENTRVVGLTATPGRGVDDLENRRLAEFFDGNKIGITGPSGVPIESPLRMLQDEGYLAKIARRLVPTDVVLDLTEAERKHVATFLDVPPSVLEKLGNDAGRNACLLGEIFSLVERNHSVLVFACSVEHAHLVSELLLLRDVESRCIDGSTPKDERAAFIRAYQEGEVKVLVNYGVLAQGFDAPRTSAVVIARPTASLVLYSQMVGRGIRGPKVGGHSECVLVDLQDNLAGFPNENQAFTFFESAWASGEGEQD